MSALYALPNRPFNPPSTASSADDTHEIDFRQLVEASSDVVWSALPSGTLTYLSPAIETVYALSAADWIGHPLTSLIHCEDRPEVQAIFERAIATGETAINAEFRLRTADPAVWKYVTSNIVLVKSQGQIVSAQGSLRDISAQKDHELALQQSQQLLQQVIDSIPAVVVWKDRDSVYQGGNRHLLPITGFEHTADIVGKTDYDMPWKLAETEWFLACDRRIMAADEPELRIIEPQRQADGKDAWLSTSKIPLHDANGKVNGILVVIEDITEQRQAELALQQQEAQYRAIFENAADGIFINSLDSGQILAINAAACEIFGYSETEFLQIHPSQITHPDYLSRFHQCVESVAAGHTYANEVICLSKKGDLIHFDVKATRIEVNGEARMLSVLRNVSDRKAAEHKTKQTQRQLQEYADQQVLLNQLTNHIRRSLNVDTIIQAAVESLYRLLNLGWAGFAWYDPTTKPATWHVTYDISAKEKSRAGGYLADVVGPIEQELLAQEFICIDDVSLYPEAAHRQFLQDAGTQARLMISIHTKQARVGILICDYRDAPHAWTKPEVELAMSVSDQLAIAIDQAQLYETSQKQAQQLTQALNQLKQTQAQMVHTEKMSSLGQMVAGIAHEINNPVNFIHANLRPARDYTEDLLALVGLYQNAYPQPPEHIAETIEDIDLSFIQQDFLQLIRSMSEGTQRIRDIVLSLRNFSRLDEAAYKSVDLHEGIESTLLILAHRLKRREPQIELIKAYGDLPLVDCYPSQLNQVVMNIVGNAIDALEDTPDPQIRLTTAIAQGQIVICISDNGPGISEETKKRIFDPFYTTKSIGKGTGMGLSISHQIITQRHGGRLWVESALGQGTKFTITIPARSASV